MDRSMLARATEGTDAPTPGYLYVDLAKAAAANPVACQDMANYLTRRLQSKNNPNIKYKCCKVIAKLAETVPRNNFRRCVAQDPSAVSAIKEAMNYRGTIDPVRGDQPNQRVRVAAKEALDAVYSEAPSSESLPAGSFGGPGISASYAPSPHASSYSSSAASAGAARRMDGIGNPNYSDPRMDPRYNGTQPTNFREAIKEAGDVVMGMIKDPLARNVEVPPPRQGHSGELPGYGKPPQSYGRPPPGAAELSRQTGGQWTMASNRGPAAIQNSDAEYYKQRDTSFQWAQKQGSAAHAAGAVGGSWASPAAPHHSTPSITVNTMPTNTGRPASDGTYERNLIMELCPPGGMKPVPPPDKLANFTRSVPSLNSDLICPVLLDCLEDGQPWIIRAKALCVMETCIQSGGRPDGTNPYRDFFHACHEEIAPLTSHARAGIHDPARRVLELLGVAVPAAAAAAPPAAPAPNLLDFDNAPPAAAAPQPPPSQPPPPPPPQAAAANAGSMFGGMQVKSTAGSAVAPVAATSSGGVPASSSGDLLGDLTSNTTAPPVTEKPDVFQENGATQQPQQQPPNTMFAQMNLKTETAENKAAAPDDTLTAGGGGSSAFGFINDTSAEPEPPAKPSFDPLTNLTPQSAAHQRKIMQLSPEQMQAMAYQQNMWMQQQQMQQQMQMAMAMQGRGMMPPGVFVMPQAMPQAANPALQSFQNARPAKKDDKKFDFVKDAMQTAGQKK